MSKITHYNSKEHIRSLSLKDQVIWFKTNANTLTQSDLQQLLPEINVHKYFPPNTTISNTSHNTTTTSNTTPNTTTTNTTPNTNTNSIKPPVYLACLEKEVLYPSSYTRTALQDLIQIIIQTATTQDLLYLHQTISQTLITSFTHQYSEEYDRWLVLIAIKLLSTNYDHLHRLTYFSTITTRIKTSISTFRDRTIILSDYITNQELTHQSPESTYFCNDIPISIQVEEPTTDQLSPETIPTPSITTLNEYYQTISQPSFTQLNPPEQQAILQTIHSLLPTTAPTRLHKLALPILEVLISLSTPPALSLITHLLATHDLALIALNQAYNRNKYSFYTRHLLITALILISPKLRPDICQKIKKTLISNSDHFSEEDQRLGIDQLLQTLQ
ncbi:hypothetical protein NEHOM01_2160 [Nematocida homosporus]|uniref:uncharacterized protein n=1 Tax=Nematocida homosporus TaxID=1912981 RepID=UPI00221ECAD8|nr:uncharacterized protein NEHOM01_2160 [Nematocida homosporus]KAI5187415.1 hypothetical protein NEHOM01_2160 [Nematocida homosporus]